MGAERRADETRARAVDEDGYEDYFADVSDGCGCAELWEYMSERRRER